MWHSGYPPRHDRLTGDRVLGSLGSDIACTIVRYANHAPCPVADPEA